MTAHALFFPSVATQVPLDAKKDSPGSAAGSLPAMLSHVCPFVVRTTGNCPFTESLWDCESNARLLGVEVEARHRHARRTRVG